MLPLIQVPSHFRIIAHRGACAYAPENTAAAFRLAVKMHATEFELDTQLSADGKVVLCHDSTLERYGHGTRIVEAMTWEELRQLDMGSWFSAERYRDEKMLTLAELFDEYRETVTYHVEIKGRARGLPAAVCQEIQNFRMQSSCVVTSFSYEALAAIRSINLLLRLGWLVDQIDEGVIARSKEIGLFQLCPRADRVTRELVAEWHAVVPEVRVWGLNGDPQRVLQLIEQAVNAHCDGMTINWPDWAVQVKENGERGT